MTTRNATLIAAGAIASLVGGAILWWMRKPKVEVKTKRPSPVPDDITPEQMEADMDELGASMVGGMRERYYELCNKIQEDLRLDTILWFRPEEFDFASHKKYVEFMMMGLAFVVHAANKIVKGEWCQEFDVCIRESSDIAVGAAIRIGDGHPTLKSRNIQHSVRALVDLMSNCQSKEELKEVAV